MASYQRLASNDGGTFKPPSLLHQPQQQMNPIALAINNHRTFRYVMVLGILIVTIFLYVCYYTTPIMSEVTSHHYQVLETQPQHQASHPFAESPAGGSHDDQNFFVLGTNTTTYSVNSSISSSVSSSRVTATNSSLMISSGNGISIGGPGELVGGGGGADENTTGEAKEGLGRIIVKSEASEADEQKSWLGSSIMSVLETKKHDLENAVIIIPKVDPPSKKEISSMILASNSTRKMELDPTKGIRTSQMYEKGHFDPAAEICPNKGEQINLLVLITSAPSHRDARLAIRQTWGHYGTRRDTAIGFMVGATRDSQMESELSSESFIYGDLIRGNSIDSYNNLTLKTISMLEWVDSYCRKAKFFLKTDDDMFINVPKLVQFIDKHKNEKRHIFGRLAKKWKPIRNRKSKYYVSPQQYLPKYFPDFTTGPAYLMTSDVIRDLYIRSLNEMYLKLEDVFTTGIVAELMKVKRVHVTEFLNRRVAFNPCTIRKAISVHMVKGKEQFDLWKKLMDPILKCK